MDDNTDKFMEAAFQKARDALKVGEVPIGCVFVYESEIISSGRNTVNQFHNATRHAEINAIDELIDWCNLKNKHLQDVAKLTTLYVNVEPCAMCAAAVHEIGIGQIVYGCSNDKFGGCGSVVDVHQLCYSTNSVDIVKGIRGEEAIMLLKAFYDAGNPNAPPDKVKRRVYTAIAECV